MNYIRDTGWYYTSLSNRAAAWSGVEYLHRFMLSNKGDGPYGSETHIQNAQPGDVIQLSFDGLVFSHSLFVVNSASRILVATHTDDCDNRPLDTYNYRLARLIHIEGIRP
jgi:hypothetical protein